MFELSDEEDQNFWENIPFEKLETSINSTPVVSRQVTANSTLSRKEPRAERHQQKTSPDIIEDPRKKKATKRKFPGPAGNLPANMTVEALSPECVKASPAFGKPETSNDKEAEDPVASQTCLEEAFSSRQWKKLLSDLGPDASSVLAKFSLKSMLFKANKKRLPRGKIPLILGYVERVDFQGRDGSVVIRDPSGKMNGSVHQELIKDPSTAVQVGWVLVLRQVSVISPSARSHYLNITTGNIVAVYRLNKDNEVTVSSCPYNGSPPVGLQQGNSNFMSATVSPRNSLHWDKLLKESEEELRSARTPVPVAPTKVPSSFPALNQVRLPGSALISKPGPSGHFSGPSPLFVGSTAVHNYTPQHHAQFNPGYRSSTANPILSNVNTNNAADGVFDDDFPDDDDHEILSLCDPSAFDAQQLSNNRRMLDKPDIQPAVKRAPYSNAIRIPPAHSASLPSSSSKPNLASTALKTLATANSPSSCQSNNKKSFSFKLTPSISSPGSQSLTGAANQETNFSFQRLGNHGSVSSISDGSKTDRNFKIHLGNDNSVAHCKENKTEMNNIFGHWNDDLSDELLSQLTEDF